MQKGGTAADQGVNQELVQQGQEHLCQRQQMYNKRQKGILHLNTKFHCSSTVQCVNKGHL